MMSTNEELKKAWDELEVSIPENPEVYPVKRMKFAKIIHEIDLAINEGRWRWFRTWAAWDTERLPLTYCFTCRYPIKPTKTVSPQGAIKKIQCPVCDLVLFDARYD